MAPEWRVIIALLTYLMLWPTFKSRMLASKQFFRLHFKKRSNIDVQKETTSSLASVLL